MFDEKPRPVECPVDALTTRKCVQLAGTSSMCRARISKAQRSAASSLATATATATATTDSLLTQSASDPTAVGVIHRHGVWERRGAAGHGPILHRAADGIETAAGPLFGQQVLPYGRERGVDIFMIVTLPVFFTR
jgi:hypothetical protein